MIKQEPGESGIYKAIARAARVCYASSNVDGEIEMVQRLIKSKHYRPLEFGTVYLTIPDSEVGRKYLTNPFSKVRTEKDFLLITTNYRVLVENMWLNDLQYLSNPTSHYKRYTFLWTISRSVADEYRTHVTLSSLMQSTRYCCYAKKKFGNQLTFIEPSDSHENPWPYKLTRLFWKVSEIGYKWLIKSKARAEQARRILPLDIATVLIQCGFEDSWNNFFSQRYLGTTGKPHPDAKYIAKQAYASYQKKI